MAENENLMIDWLLGEAGSSVYERGSSYFFEKKVSGLQKKQDLITGNVLGSELYQIKINPEKKSASCTCPATWPCKHLVAATLTVMAEHPDWLKGKKTELAGIMLGPESARLVKINPESGAPENVKPGDTLLDYQNRKLRYTEDSLNFIDPSSLAPEILHNFPLFSATGVKLKYKGVIPLSRELVRDPGNKDNYLLRHLINDSGADIALTSLSPVHISEKPNRDGFRDCFLVRPDLTAEHLFRISLGGRKSLTDADVLDIQEMYPSAEIRFPGNNNPVAFTAGPVLMLSLSPESADDFTIRAEFEFVYAAENKYLPDINEAILSSKKAATVLSRIPAILKKGYSSRKYNRDPSGNLYQRNHEKEAALLAEMGRVSFKPGFILTISSIADFTLTSIPALKARGVVINVNRSLLRLFNDGNINKNLFDFDISATGTDWFAGEISIAGLAADEFSLALDAYRKNKKAVISGDGTWISLERIGLDKLVSAFENMGVKINPDGTVKKISKGQLLSIEYETGIRTDKEILELKNKIAALPQSSAVGKAFPSRFNGKFRPYQKEGIIFLESLYELGIGGILADDMGLGKTIQGLGFIDRLDMKANREHLVLIVGPLASIGVWKKEAEKFFPHLSLTVWHGNSRKESRIPEHGIILTTYGTLSRDFSDWEGQHRFDLALLDEAQNLKNFKSLASHAVRKTGARAYYCLTGTPVENSLNDLWSLMDLVFPGYFGTRKSFLKSWPFGADAALRKKISPFILRRTKAKVISELPPLAESAIPVAMTGNQRKIYEEARKNALLQLSMAGSDYLVKLLPHLTRLRRLACHPETGKGAGTDPALSGKFRYLADSLEEIIQSSSGVLIFSQFTDVLAICSRLIREAGHEHHYLDGSTSLKKREQMVEEFQAGSKHFFLISLKAGGTALTLHRADTVIHLDPWWNPAAERQASDRAHRIGQKRKVMVYKLYSENSIEEKVLELQKKKQLMFDTLFSEEDQGKARLTREELGTLLEI